MAKTSPGEFIRQVRAEAGKVVWPTWPETYRTAIFVAPSVTTNVTAPSGRCTLPGTT